MVVRNGQARQRLELQAVPLQRQQRGLVAGNDQVEAFAAQQCFHGTQPRSTVTHPGWQIMDGSDVTRAEGDGAEIRRRHMHRYALATQGADRGQKASCVVTEDQRLARRHKLPPLRSNKTARRLSRPSGMAIRKIIIHSMRYAPAPAQTPPVSHYPHDHRTPPVRIADSRQGSQGRPVDQPRCVHIERRQAIARSSR